MCGSMVDIQSPTSEIRQGKKKKERRKIQSTGVKYNGLPITVGGHNSHRQAEVSTINRTLHSSLHVVKKIT